MYYSRKIYQKLEKNIENNKIIVLTGARQVGKTTLMKMIFNKISKNSNSVFIDMDLVANHDIGEKLENFINFLLLNGYNKKQKRFYVFIDEFQRVPQMAVILKNIYDHYSNIKIFATGSSSLSIKKNIKESLAGRKFIFEINPLDFEEFLDFKKDDQAKKYYKNIQKIKSGNIVFSDRFYRLFEEFIIFGGYPEVVLAKEDEEKKKILKSIFDLYLEKDVMVFKNIENIWAYKKLVQLVAVDSGQLINYNNLANETGIHNKTLRSYLLLLEESYLINIVRPFFTNKHKEITKTPKVYFADNGVRNYFLNNFNKLEQRVDKGAIFENYILQEILKNKQENEIKYWRTKEKNEVDFIIEKNGKIIPIEAKLKAKNKVDYYRNVLKFLNNYNKKEGVVLSMNFSKKINKNKRNIRFIPAINFMSNL